ncbi:hypothetical protein [Flavivirga spongiicola]|uniref:Uncharacterized protein n=2 Tax=Flavivirga spongiicola TaxID=421621 RepID=A0ABU7XUS2_9FLAO|nr:hypothetical protein [Flavivirga sp. MEBiC05379]MDO5979184.1 hypothetical protein [Flavivirga sp. MEBiC05379]
MKEVIGQYPEVVKRVKKYLNKLNLSGHQKSNLEFSLEKLKKYVELKKKEINNLQFINNFNDLNENKVYSYFYKKLVDKKYLTQESLELYLKLAFEELEYPSSRFRFSEKAKSKNIKKIFYNFYKVESSKPHGEQEKYVKILGEYFEGYSTDALKTNFSKIY